MNDKIKKSLAEVSIEDLLALVSEKKQATYQPLITEYTETETKLAEILGKIQTIDPSWNPPTLADKIAGFLKANPTKNKESDIVENFKTVQSGYVKNTLKKGVDTKWTVKEQKYTLVAK